jgi:uncharacterized protein (DUF433 family)
MASSAALTVNEVVAFSGIEEGRVRKDVEHGLFGMESPPKFDRVAIIYFRVMAELGMQPGVEDRRKIYRLIGEAFASSNRPTIVKVSPVLDLKLTRVTKDVGDTIRRFEAWKKKRVSIDPEILGGEPTFSKTRLAVRHIGGLVLQDAIDEIREDYPYLSDEDIEFAKLYTLAYPKRGRPRIRRASKSS